MPQIFEPFTKRSFGSFIVIFSLIKFSKDVLIVVYTFLDKDLIVIFEDSQTIEYPTVHFDIRNENYSFTLHIRTVQDERAGTDGDFGKDRLRALYLITRHVLEGKRTGYTASDGSKFNQIFVGSRNESNDRKKRIFGYKISIEAKRFALSVP